MKSAVISRRRRPENLSRAKRVPRLPRRRKALSSSQGHSPNGAHDEPPGKPAPAVNGQSTLPARPLAPTGPRLVPARAGDHPAIHQLLLSQFRGPSSVEFQAQLDEPLYEPTDRLLVKQRDDVVAHLRLTKRLLSFGPLKISAAGFMDLATASAWQRRGFASALIGAGERQAASEGTMLGLTRTTAADLFARHGWSVCGRESCSTAGARQILAHLGAALPGDWLHVGDDERDRSPFPLRAPRPPLLVRPLRRMELPAIVRLYEECTSGAYGANFRSEVYWDWLMSRHAFERAYVAILGDDHLELPQLLAAVAGCVFVSGGRIVELLARPGASPAIGLALLARVCSDAIERNQYDVRLDAPPDHPLHQVLRAAGGTYRCAEEHDGEVSMARLFSPLQTLRDMAALLLARAREARLSPVVLGLEVFNFDADLLKATHEDARSYRLVVTNRSARLAPGGLGRNYLSLRRRDLTPLLLGHWRLEDAIAAGRVRASTRRAQRAAEVLFPPLPWHRPPLDDLLAMT